MQISHTELQSLIKEAVDFVLEESASKNQKVDHREDDTDSEPCGKYVQGSKLKDLRKHFREALGFEEQPQQEKGFYSQYNSVESDLPLLDIIKSILCKEWNDPDKQSIPHFLSKRQVLKDFEELFPPTPKGNAMLAEKASKSSLALEDSILSNVVDKQVEASIKCSYAAANLSIRANTYAAYSSQAPLKDF